MRVYLGQEIKAFRRFFGNSYLTVPQLHAILSYANIKPFSDGRFDSNTLKAYRTGNDGMNVLYRAYKTWQERTAEYNAKQAAKKAEVPETKPTNPEATQLSLDLRESQEDQPLPPYDEWRTNIGTEFRNCRRNKKGNCYYIVDSDVGRVFFIDKKNHATQHLGTTLLNQCLNKLDFNDLFSSYGRGKNGNAPSGHYEKSFTFPYNIGYNECVETNDDDKIIYTNRAGRDKKSRIALNIQPSPSNIVFLVLKPCDLTRNIFMIITAYVGDKAAIEPWNYRAGEDEVNFWKNHALIGNYKESDDLGDEGYWGEPNKVTLNLQELKQLVKECVKKTIEVKYKKIRS
jgi:hypothetical protein